MQQNIFSDTAAHHKKNTSLTINKTGKEKLTKNQEAFNKLTARIEKLHKEIEKKETQFEAALSIYSTAIHPLRKEILILTRKLVDQLWQVYKSKQLSKQDLRHLKAILQENVESLLQSTNKPDEELKAIFGELEGESYESVRQREEAMMKQEVKEMFDNMNVDIDLSDVDINDKIFAEKIADANEKMREKLEREQEKRQQQNNRQQRVTKKTTKQLEAEKMQQAVDEMKHKNINTIYRQLAKLFHPDLEQDEERRIEKGELMKQLTAAYEAKNLHALLSLELKWIHKENDHLASLTEEKLGIYLQILKEQAAELEMNKYKIFQKPQYAILMEDFGYPVVSQPLLFIKKEQLNLEAEANSIKTDLQRYQSEHGHRYIKQMIRAWKERDNDQEDSDALFDSIMWSNGRGGH